MRLKSYDFSYETAPLNKTPQPIFQTQTLGSEIRTTTLGTQSHDDTQVAQVPEGFGENRLRIRFESKRCRYYFSGPK